MIKHTLTFEELLQGSLENTTPDAPSLHRAKTAACLSFGQFERHVKGKAFFNADQLKHVNRCPDYCQPTLSFFRKHCGMSLQAIGAEALVRIRGWVKEVLLPSRTEEEGNRVEILPHLTFEFGAPVDADAEMPPPTYRAVVEGEEGRVVGEGKVIIITQGPFLENDYLAMTIRVSEPEFPLERCPIQLSLVSLNDGQILNSFDLLDLNNEQLLTTKLSKSLLTQPVWQQLEETEHLPFGFVLRALGKGQLLAQDIFEEANNELRRFERTIHTVPTVDHTETSERQVEWRSACPFSPRLGDVAFAATACSQTTIP